MSNLIVKEVEFNGSQLMAAQDKQTQKIYVGVSWICRGIGLNKDEKDRQVKNVQTDIVLKQGCVKFDAGVFDTNNATLGIELDFLPLWLAKISITPKMQEEQTELTEKLIQYQLKAKAVLAVAFLSKEKSYTKSAKHIHHDTILKHKLSLVKQLAQGRPKEVLQKLQVEAILQTQEETGFDYSRILEALKVAERFTIPKVMVNIQPLLDYLNGNPDIGIEHDGYLYIKSKEFKKIIRKIELNYLTVARELNKANMIKTRIDNNKLCFTGRISTSIDKCRDYYIAIKYTKNSAT